MKRWYARKRILIIDWLIRHSPYLAFRWGMLGIMGAIITSTGRTLAAEIALADLD